MYVRRGGTLVANAFELGYARIGVGVDKGSKFPSLVWHSVTANSTQRADYLDAGLK